MDDLGGHRYVVAVRRSGPNGLRVVRLFGGLGNQLFQHAAMKGLCPNEAVVVEDSSSNIAILNDAVQPGAIRRLTSREAFVLGRPPVWPGRRKIQTLMDIQRSKAVRRVLDKRVFFDARWGVFDDSMAAAQTPVLYQGYFQNERYFAHAADEVVAAMAPASPEATRMFGLASADVRGRETVAVHLRVGPEYQQLGWALPPNWYRRAAVDLADRLGHIGFVIASDVPAAAVDMALGLADIGPASCLTPGSPYDTIRAIGLADHAIISASSFSWWGAWLGDYRCGFDPQRQVVAPAFWLQPGMDPPPSRWLRLSNDE